MTRSCLIRSYAGRLGGMLLGAALMVTVAACGGRNTPGNAVDGGFPDGHIIGDAPRRDAAKYDFVLPFDVAIKPDTLPSDARIVPPSDGPVVPPDGPIVFDTISHPDLGPVDNATCAKAAFVPLVNGKAQITGSTKGATNEYGTAINCGSLTSTYNGAQRYYKFSLKGGTNYRFTFADSYSNERMYIVRACGIPAINADCGSHGKTGATTVGTENDLFFTPPATGDYIVVLDAVSTSSQSSGSFTLTVQPYTLPTNTTCSAATALTLTGGKVTVKGSTAGSQNEFGTQINCGSVMRVFSAPQVYYTLPMTVGMSYRISLKPQFTGARF